jgi:cytochrome b subunit of formate dehydrogenase
VFSRPKLDDLFGKDRRLRILDGLRVLIYLLTLLLLEQKLNLIGILRKLVYLVALLCFIVLLVTGFFQRLVLAESISGYLLMLHATAAGVFAACLAILAVMWAHNCRFNKNDWPWLQKLLQREAVNKAAGEKYELWQKVSFWMIVFLALPLILSSVLSMFMFFGTEWQEFLLNVHRYSALTLALAAIVHTYLMTLTRT